MGNVVRGTGGVLDRGVPDVANDADNLGRQDTARVQGQRPADRRLTGEHRASEELGYDRHRAGGGQAESWRVLGLRTCGIVDLTRRRPVCKTVAPPRIGDETSRAVSVGCPCGLRPDRCSWTDTWKRLPMKGERSRSCHWTVRLTTNRMVSSSTPLSSSNQVARCRISPKRPVSVGPRRHTILPLWKCRCRAVPLGCSSLETTARSRAPIKSHRQSTGCASGALSARGKTRGAPKLAGGGEETAPDRSDFGDS